MGGKAFTRGHIYQFFSTPIYIGEIHHKGQRERTRAGCKTCTTPARPP